MRARRDKGVVARTVKVAVNAGDRAVLVDVAVDGGSHDGQLGNQVNAVLIDKLPVLVLGKADGR